MAFLLTKGQNARMTVRKSHPFIRFIYNRLREEHLAWRIMFREEWVSLLVVLGSVLLVVFFTRPLPPREVTLAVGNRARPLSS